MAKIDPAFQAAPYLGDSSHDPTEFTRRHNLAKYQAKKQEQERIQKNTAAGLENLMLDLKGWEDQEGFKEIMKDQDQVMNTFLNFSRKGMNLTSPRTTDEVLIYKSITDAHERIKQKVDTWNQNKTVYDLIQKGIIADAEKPESEQRIDRAATQAKIAEFLKSTKIQDRGNKIPELIVTKPQLGDMYEYVRKNKDILPKLDVVTEPYVNEQGVTISKTREIETPEWRKETEVKLKELYNHAPEAIKNFVKKEKIRETDPAMQLLSEDEYFAVLNVPSLRQKWVDKTVGAGGGIDISFLGQKKKIQPGVLALNPREYGGRTYNDRYEFPSSPTFQVPVGLQGSFYHAGMANPQTGSDGWIPVPKTGGDIEATLNFYDPKTDVFTFRTTQGGMTPFTYPNMTFSVPRKTIGNQADDLPIMVDGKKRKLKDIYPKDIEKPAIKLIGGKDLSGTPYIPKNK